VLERCGAVFLYTFHMRPQGTELHRRFQRGLEVLSLYESISDEVSELQEYYERQAQRNIDAATRQLQHDMAENVAATKKLQESMTDDLKIVANVQMMVEWIEIFVVPENSTALAAQIEQRG
jgi:hypothetical protein